ncbi:hypothetical protein Ancab_012410 [Ancistrocladus abbreviatus]
MQDPTVFTQLKPHFPEQELLKCPRCDSTNTKFCYYNNYNLAQPRHFCKSCRRYWTKGGALRNIPVGGGSRKNTKRSSNSKRSSSSSSSSSSAPNTSTQNSNPNPKPETNSILGSKSNSNSNSSAAVDDSHHRQDESSTRMLDISAGSFSSLLSSNGQFGNLLDVFNSNGSGVKFVANPSLSLNSEAGLIRNPGLELQSNNGISEGFLGSLQTGDSSCWEAGINDNGHVNGNDDGNGNGWPDLSIYTPDTSNLKESYPKEKVHALDSPNGAANPVIAGLGVASKVIERKSRSGSHGFNTIWINVVRRDNSPTNGAG